MLGEDEAVAALDGAAPARAARRRGRARQPGGRRAAAHPRRVDRRTRTLRAELQQARAPTRRRRTGATARHRRAAARSRARLDAISATACASSRPTGRTPIAWRRCCARWGFATDVCARRAGASCSRSAQDPASSTARWRSCSGSLRRGFALPADRLVARRRGGDLRRARAPRGARHQGARALGDLGEIAEGDAVVHDEHGIGRYRGLKKLTVRGVPARLPAPRVRRRHALPAGLPARRRAALRRRRGATRRSSTSSAA